MGGFLNLLKRLNQGVPAATEFLRGTEKSLYGEDQPLTGADLATISQGRQENRGLGNILQNFLLEGAQRRAGKRSLEQEEEDREMKRQMQAAQIKNLESLSETRGRRLDIQSERNEIARVKNEGDLQAKERDLDRKEKELEQEVERNRIAAQNAQTTSARLQAEVAWRNADRELEWLKTEGRNALEEKRIEISKRFAEVAERQAGVAEQRVGLEGERLDIAKAEEARAAESQPFKLFGEKAEAMSDVMKAITAGQEGGFLTEPGARRTQEVLGLPGLTGQQVPEPRGAGQAKETLKRWLGLGAEQAPVAGADPYAEIVQGVTLEINGKRGTATDPAAMIEYLKAHPEVQWKVIK